MPPNASPVAYRNGEWIAADALSIAIDDVGFLQGVTAVERLRSYGGQLRFLDDHLRRLRDSIELLRIPAPGATMTLRDVCPELLRRNLTATDDEDLTVVCVVTPGRATQPQRPTVIVHTLPVHWRRIVQLLEQGQRLRLSDIQVPGNASWPRRAKCRARPHYYLADIDTDDAAAVLRDQDGSLTETSSANLVAVHDGVLSIAPEDRILPGITLQHLIGIATQHRREVRRVPITESLLRSADEVLLSGTGPGIWAATAIDEDTIGTGVPGPVCREYQRLWDEHTGCDTLLQARRAVSG